MYVASGESMAPDACSICLWQIRGRRRRGKRESQEVSCIRKARGRTSQCAEAEPPGAAAPQRRPCCCCCAPHRSSCVCPEATEAQFKTPPLRAYLTPTATHHSWCATSQMTTLTCGAMSPLPAHSAPPVAMTSKAWLLSRPPPAGSDRAATMVRSRLSTASTDASHTPTVSRLRPHTQSLVRV